MSAFDDLDKRVATAIGRVFENPVVHRPMRERPGSGIANGAIEPDPTRQARYLGAIVTWRPEVIPAGTNQDQGGVTSFDCTVDFDVQNFTDSSGLVGELPRKPDIVELLSEEDKFGPHTIVEIQMPNDDGTSRIVYYCTRPQ